MFRASPLTLPRLHRTVCPLAHCWFLIQTVSILQDYCNQETAVCALGAVSVCRRLVLGGVTALTNEAGCMVEHHLRPANLIRSIRRNGRLLKRLGLIPSWLDIFSSPSLTFGADLNQSLSHFKPLAIWKRQRHPKNVCLAMFALSELIPSLPFLLNLFSVLNDITR